MTPVDLAALEGLHHYCFLREGRQILTDAVNELRELRALVAARDPGVPVLRFTIERPPAKKNEKQARRVGTPCGSCKLPMGPVVQYDSHEVKKSVVQIQDVAVAALRTQQPECYRARRALLLDEDVRVEMVHHVHAEALEVRIYNAGPKPRGRTGRRNDVANLPEIVLDALQGIAFHNDNQVTRLEVMRSIDSSERNGVTLETNQVPPQQTNQ